MDRMRARLAFGYLVIATLLAILVFAARPAAASADVALNTYLTPDGNRYFIEDGGTMPPGSTLRITVFADLFSCDPVTVNWGDGTTESRTYGGSLAQSWEHMYNATGPYTISATEPCGSGGNVRTINVGSGGLAIFNPSGALFLPTVLGLIFGFIAVGLALGKVKPAPANVAAAPPAVPRLVPINPLGTPYSMVANLVSFRDIPVGAPRQEDPRQQFTPGEPTDVTRPPPCPTCRGPMGFAAGGWFCLNPNCPLRQQETPWPRVVHGIMHP